MIERFEQFATGISQIYKSIQRIKSQEMKEFDLKGTHVMCIFELHHNKEGLTMGQLSDRCDEDKSAISRTVSYLVSRGLVISDASKKYRAPILLTEEGRDIGAKIDQMVSQAVVVGGEGLTDAERDAFYKALSLISDNLKEYLETDEN